MLEIILCVIEPLVVLACVVVPFAILGIICELIKYVFNKGNLNKGNEYHMGAKRQMLHRKIYDFLCDKGYDNNVAYRIATQITHWE